MPTRIPDYFVFAQVYGRSIIYLWTAGHSHAPCCTPTPWQRTRKPRQSLDLIFKREIVPNLESHTKNPYLFDIIHYTPSIMAKFTPGAIVSEVRNKIAATVFTRNKAGASIRNRITPINRRSVGQTTHRQILSALASSWRGLTQAQISAWNSAASNFPQQDNLGQTIFLTGEQLYIRCNANLQLIGESQISDAPSPASFATLTLTSLTVAAGAGTMSLAFSPTVPAGFKMVARGTAPMSAGKNFVSKSKFKFLKAIAAAATSPQALATEYENVFGALAGTAGEKIFVECYLVEIASGLAGIPVRVQAVVSA
jgi:hypothetical protein